MKKGKFEIKKLDIKDTETIVDLVHEVVSFSLGNVYPPSALKWFYDYHSTENVKNDFNSGAEIYGAYDNDTLIGTVTYNNNELKRLFIHPDYQKIGLGKVFINKVEDLATELESEYIMLYANPNTWRYYNLKGYEPINFAAAEMDAGEFLAYCTMVKTFISGDWEIELASKGDAGELLEGQKRAFYDVAEAHNHLDMPPMTETEESIINEMERAKVFIARKDGKIIGSVRGEQNDGACCISRLWVLPEYQGKGLGHALMYAVEDYFTDYSEYRLFTGSKSEKTIEFYKERGYVEKTREPVKDYELVYFEKMNAMGFMD